MKSESDRPITIENLLRLKRAERPPAEFWGAFDRELRAKQLSALVGKRPWWQRLPLTFPRLFTVRMVVGAASIVAIGLVALRQDFSSPAVQMQDVSLAADEGTVPVRDYSVEPLREVAQLQNVVTVSSASLQDAEVDAVRSSSIAAAERPMADVFASEEEKADGSSSPSSRTIATNLEIIRAAQTESNGFLAQNHGFEARVMPARAAVEPLQQMTPPSDSRRSRLLTAMVANTSLESSMRTTERAASRIDEERLYEQIQRFGARGDRLQYKF